MADERRMRAARDEAELDLDEATADAIQFVFDAVDIGTLVDLDQRLRTWGLLTIPDVSALEAAISQELAALLDHPLVFTDRHGQVVAPASVALTLAKRLCAEAAETVMAAVITDETEHHREAITGRSYGKDFISPEIVQKVMREYSEPIWRLVRSWCDADTVARYDELATLRAEVARLRAIIMEQVKFLRQYRHPHLAKALEERLDEVVAIEQ